MLNFTFKDGESVLYDVKIPYREEDGFIIFEVDASKFKFKSEKNHFVKEDEDAIFEIKEVDGHIKCVYTLKDEELCVEVKVLHFEHIIGEKEHTLKYTIESDEDREKCIILKKE